MRQQLFIFLSLFGYLSTAIGAAETTIDLKWSCPQLKYSKLNQLPQTSELKITFAEKLGELAVQIKPNIFNIANSSVSINYDLCLKQLNDDLLKQLNQIKQTQCHQQTELVVCTRVSEDLNAALTRYIGVQKYFKNPSSQVIPTLLPGIDVTGYIELGTKSVTDFCESGKHNGVGLFSKTTLASVANYASTSSLPPGLVCLKKYYAEHEKIRLNVLSNSCPEPKELCQQVSNSLKQTDAQILKMIDAKSKSVNSQDEFWRKMLGLHNDNEEVLNILMARLEKRPAKCQDLISFVKINHQVSPLSDYPKAFAQYASKLSETADADCLKQMTQNYATSLSMAKWKQTEIKTYCREHASEFCSEIEKLEQLHQQNIRQLLAMSYGESSQLLNERCDDCDQSPGSQFKDLLNTILNNKEALVCLELKPGQTKVVSSRDGKPTGTSGNYGLTKRADGGFEVTVAMSFPESDNAMMNRVQSCIDSVTPYFKGSQGQQLTLKVISPADVAQLPSAHRPMINDVRIQSADSRSNSASYAANIDCPTITHEVLHLLGLCDEYSGTLDGFTCRASPKIASIMSNQREAFKKGLPETLTCECTTEVCRKIMGGDDNLKRDIFVSSSIYEITSHQLRNKYCTVKELPALAWKPEDHSIPLIINKRTDRELNIISYSIGDNVNKVIPTVLNCNCASGTNCAEDLASIAQSVERAVKDKAVSCPGSSALVTSTKGLPAESKPNYSWNGKRFTLAKPAEWPSLLHPQHFDRITGGACPKAAQKYSECAQWAYKSKQDTNNCQGKPAYCNSDQEFLGVSQ